MPPKAWIVGLVAVVGCVPLASCGTGTHAAADTDNGQQPIVFAQPGEMPEGHQGSTAWVHGDWDDIEAAATVGTDQADCAIVRILESSERMWKAQIKSVRDERGTLTAIRPMSPCIGTPESIDKTRITLVCELGVLGNAQAEHDVLEKTTRRLRDLFGIDYAPIR